MRIEQKKKKHTHKKNPIVSASEKNAVWGYLDIHLVSCGYSFQNSIFSKELPNLN